MKELWDDLNALGFGLLAGNVVVAAVLCALGAWVLAAHLVMMSLWSYKRGQIVEARLGLERMRRLREECDRAIADERSRRRRAEAAAAE